MVECQHVWQQNGTNVVCTICGKNGATLTRITPATSTKKEGDTFRCNRCKNIHVLHQAYYKDDHSAVEDTFYYTCGDEEYIFDVVDEMLDSI